MDEKARAHTRSFFLWVITNIGNARVYKYMPLNVEKKYIKRSIDFLSKPLLEHSGKKRVLIASDSNWSVKRTDIAIRSLSKIRDDADVSIIAYSVDFERTLSLAYSLGLHVNILPKVPHEKLNQYY